MLTIYMPSEEEILVSRRIENKRAKKKALADHSTEMENMNLKGLQLESSSGETSQFPWVDIIEFKNLQGPVHLFYIILAKKQIEGYFRKPVQTTLSTEVLSPADNPEVISRSHRRRGSIIISIVIHLYDRL